MIMVRTAAFSVVLLWSAVHAAGDVTCDATGPESCGAALLQLAGTRSKKGAAKKVKEAYCDDMPYCALNYTDADCDDELRPICPSMCGLCEGASSSSSLLEAEVASSDAVRREGGENCCSVKCGGHGDCGSGLFCCPRWKICMGMDTGGNFGSFCDECTEKKRLANVDEDLPALKSLVEEEVKDAVDIKATCSASGGHNAEKICDGNLGSLWITDAVDPLNVDMGIEFELGAPTLVNGIGIYVNSASYTSTIRDVELGTKEAEIGRFEVNRAKGWNYFGGFSINTSTVIMKVVSNHGYGYHTLLFEAKLLSGVDLIPAQTDKFEKLEGTCEDVSHVSGRLDARSNGECEKQCLENDECFAYVSNGEYCYLKGRCSGKAGGTCTGHCTYRLKGLKGSAFEGLATTCQNPTHVSGRIEVTSIAECEKKCAGESRCGGFNSNGEYCYLKGDCGGEAGTCSAGGACGFRKLSGGSL